MVSIGGVVANVSQDTSYTQWLHEDYYYNPPDPWPQGIGIFDMTAMEWKEGYDADAAPYMTPDVVKAYYQQNGRNPASWTNDIVRTWFTHPGSNPMDSNINSSIPQTKTPTLSASSKTRRDAIAGGSVGGIAIVAIIALFTFISLRRRRRLSRLTVPPRDTGYQKPELDNQHRNTVPGVTNSLCEMQDTNDPSEMQGIHYISEMQGCINSNELQHINNPTELEGVVFACELPQREDLTTELSSKEESEQAEGPLSYIILKK